MTGVLLSIGDMARRMGVCVATLRRWDRQGKLKPAMRSIGGHRRYSTQSQALLPETTVLYAHVSSHDQKADLARQKQRLASFAGANGWTNVQLVSDLGSGLNFRKRGLLHLLDMILHRRLTRLVLENKDRLLRFGAELLFRLCAAQGIEVVIIEHKPQNFEADLAKDVLEIITVFSARPMVLAHVGQNVSTT
jgi:putative resolvase